MTQYTLIKISNGELSLQPRSKVNEKHPILWVCEAQTLEEAKEKKEAWYQTIPWKQVLESRHHDPEKNPCP